MRLLPSPAGFLTSISGSSRWVQMNTFQRPLTPVCAYRAVLDTLRTFLVSTNPAYKEYAQRLYPAYQSVPEVASAQIQDLVSRNIREGAAGMIIHAAKTQAGGALLTKIQLRRQAKTQPHGAQCTCSMSRPAVTTLLAESNAPELPQQTAISLDMLLAWSR